MNKLARLVDNEVHYLPNYKLIHDQILMRKPTPFMSPLSRPTTINYSMKGFRFAITNFQHLSQAIHDYIVEQNKTNALCGEVYIDDDVAKIIVLNSNFHNIAINGFERYTKRSEDKVRKTTRSIQGNGTSFNSAVELIVLAKISGRVVRAYKTKCFPQTGLIQIPGVLCRDLYDGKLVVKAIIDLVNEIFPDTPTLFTEDLVEELSLVNFKFHICTTTPRMIPNVNALIKILQTNSPEHGIITEISKPDFKCELVFKIGSEKKATTIKLFSSGKFNVLGAKSIEEGEHIYSYISSLFDRYWYELITIVPRTDADEAKAHAYIAEQERLERYYRDKIYDILFHLV